MKDDAEEEKLKKNKDESDEINDINEMIENINEEDDTTLKESSSDSNSKKQKTKKIMFGKFDLDKIKLKVKPINIISASGFDDEDEFTKQKRIKHYKKIKKIIFIIIGLILFYISFKKVKEYLLHDNTIQTIGVTNIDKSQVNTVEKTKDIKPDQKLSVKDDKKKNLNTQKN